MKPKLILASEMKCVRKYIALLLFYKSNLLGLLCYPSENITWLRSLFTVKTMCCRNFVL